MDIENVRINQKIYLINPDDGIIYTGLITSIFSEDFSFKLDGSSHEKDSNCKNGIARIKHKSYNSNSFIVECYLNEEDLAIRKRFVILKKMEKLKNEIENNMNKLKSFRVNNNEALNSTNIDNWIKEFSNNNQWI